MPEYDQLVQSIAAMTADYRAGEIAAPTPKHVDRWISQFPPGVRLTLLTELAHVLEKSYFTRDFVTEFLTGLVTSKKLAGDDPKSFWSGVKFLKLQTAGSSQRDFLAIFAKALSDKHGLSLDACGANPHSFLYLDDILFSGGRIGSDLADWIRGPAPKKAHVNVVVIGYHQLGRWFASKDIEKAAREAEKDISVTWWRVVEIEDRKAYMENSDVLRPTHIPNDPATQAYVAELGAEIILRKAGKVGDLGLFSGDTGRILLEQEFLKAGVQVRLNCPNLGIYQRPLGNIRLKMVGFGSMMVTFRNCPNNAPLALWAGDPWYPLFPRKTN